MPGSKASKSPRLITLSLALVGVAAAAVCTRVLPTRHEAALKNAGETALRETLKARPDDAVALYYLAVARQKAGDVTTSQALLEQAVKAAPNRDDFWLALATLTRNKGDSPQATRILSEMTTRFPQSADAHALLAEILLERDALTPAADAARRATTLDPKNTGAFLTLGRAKIRLGDFDEARAALLTAQKLDPKNWIAPLSLGDLRLEQKAYDDAARCYDQATTLAPNEPAAWLSLANSLLRNPKISDEQATRAADALKKAAPLRDSVALYPLLLAKLHVRQNRIADAGIALETARELDPGNPEIVFDLAQIARAQGKTGDAKRWLATHRTLVQAEQDRRALLTQLERNHSTPAERAELVLKLARCYKITGQLFRAQRALTQLQATNPPRSVAETVAAEIASLEADPRFTIQRMQNEPSAQLIAEANELLLKPEPDAAISRFRLVAGRDPSNAIAIQGIGLALQALGKPVESIAYFTRAAELDPKLVASQFYLGETALQYGLLIEAEQRLKIATDLDPKSLRAWSSYQRALGKRAHYPEQVEALKHCVALEPGNIAHVLELGEALVDSAKIDDAEEAFRTALTRAPNSPEVWLRLGGFLAANRETPEKQAEARKLLAKVQAIDPKNEYVAYSRAVLDLRQRKFADAAKGFETLARKPQRTQEVFYNLSRAYAGLGKAAESRNALAQSRAILKAAVDFQAAQDRVQDDVENIPQRLKVARLCVEFHQPLKALAHYRIVLTQNPRQPDALREEAALRKTLGARGQLADFSAYEGLLAAGVRPSPTPDTKR